MTSVPPPPQRLPEPCRWCGLRPGVFSVDLETLLRNPALGALGWFGAQLCLNCWQAHVRPGTPAHVVSGMQAEWNRQQHAWAGTTAPPEEPEQGTVQPESRQSAPQPPPEARKPRTKRRDDPGWVDTQRQAICVAYQRALATGGGEQPSQRAVMLALNGSKGKNVDRRLRTLLSECGLSWPPDCEDTGL